MTSSAWRSPGWIKACVARCRRIPVYGASSAAALFAVCALTPALGLTGPSPDAINISPPQAGDLAGAKSQLRLLVGSSPGGGYDTYARLISAHLPRWLPGNPRIVVQNMPGAGSLVVSNYLVNIAPRDGSVFAAVPAGACTSRR